jgi:phage shock protein C
MRRFDRLSQKGLYRSRNGAIFGVCRGIAEYFDFSVFWTRSIVVVLLFMTGLWPLTGLYLLAALLMKPEPVIAIESEGEREFYDSYASSRQRAAHRLKRRYENLERRIRRMEDAVTSKEFNWENRL